MPLTMMDTEVLETIIFWSLSCLNLFFSFLKIGSRYVVQIGLKLMRTFLLEPPRC